jgi:hypothetical protein
VALDELKQSIDDRKSDEAKQFAEAHNQYISDQSFYSNQVTQYKNEVAYIGLLISELDRIT